jgi:beta-alanine degradation protein BauB
MTRWSYLVAGILLGAFAMSGATRSTTQDPVKVSPQYYVVRFENERVRVLEYHLKPGEKEATHSHPPGVVYVLSDATIRSVRPDGSSSETIGRAGEVHWRDDMTHAVENVGNTEARALAIELKPCSR